MEGATDSPRYGQGVVNGLEEVRDNGTHESGGVSGQNESKTHGPTSQPQRPPTPQQHPSVPYGSSIRTDAPVLRRVDSRSFFPAPPQQRPSGSPNFQPQNWPRPPVQNYRPLAQNVGQYRPPVRREEDSHNSYNYESQQNYSPDNVDRRKSVSFNPNLNQTQPQPRQAPPGSIRRASPWALLKEKIPTEGRGQFIAPGPRPPLFEFRKMQSPDQSQSQKPENDASSPNPNLVRTPPPNMPPQNPMYNGRPGENMRPMPPGMMGKPMMQRPPSQDGKESPTPPYQNMQGMVRKPPPEMIRTDSSRNLDPRMNSPQERGPSPNPPRGITPGPPRSPKPPGDDDDDVVITPERMRGTPTMRPPSGGRPADVTDFSKTYTKIPEGQLERNSKSPAAMMRPESRLSNDGRSPLSMDNRSDVRSGMSSRPLSGEPQVRPVSSDGRPPSGDLSGSRPVSGDQGRGEVGSRPVSGDQGRGEVGGRPVSGDVGSRPESRPPPVSVPPSRPPSNIDTRPPSSELRKSAQSFNETPPVSPKPDLIDRPLSRQSSLSSQAEEKQKLESRGPTPVVVTPDNKPLDVNSGKSTPAEIERQPTLKPTPEPDSGIEHKTNESERTDTPSSNTSLGSVTPIPNSHSGTPTPAPAETTPNPKSVDTSRNPTPNPPSNNSSARATPVDETVSKPEQNGEKESGKIERPKSLKRTPSRKSTPDMMNGSPEDGRKTPSGRISRNSSAGKSKSDDRNDTRSPMQRKFSLKRPKSGSKTPDGDHDSGVDETTQGKDVTTTNGDLGSPNKSPSKIPAPKRLSMPSPTKSTKGSPKTPEAPSTAEKKKVPMNKVQVGAAPSPNLKTVRSKIGSLDNTSYKPGGGKVKIENRKVDFSHAQPRIAAKNDTYTPGGGDKKITQVKLAWNAKSKIGSLENAAHKPGGGDKKIESMKLDFKDKAKPKIGSKDNIKHQPGGGTVKSSDDGSQDGNPGDIEEHRLEIKAESKVGSLDNVKHKPGGGEKKIFDDKDYIKQMSSATSKAGSEGIPSGTQIEDGYCSSNTSRKTSRDRRQTSETRGERQRTPTSQKTSPNEEIKHRSLIEKHAEKQKQKRPAENGVEVKNKKSGKKQTEPATNGLSEHSPEDKIADVKENIIEKSIKEENETTNGTDVGCNKKEILNENEKVNSAETEQTQEDKECKTIKKETDVKEDKHQQNLEDNLMQLENKVELGIETVKNLENAMTLKLIKEDTEKEDIKEITLNQNNEHDSNGKQENVSGVNGFKNNSTEHKEGVEDESKSQQSSPLDQDLSNTAEDAEETDHNSNQTNSDGQSEEVDKIDIKPEETTNTVITEDLPKDTNDASKQEINLTDDDKKLSEGKPAETEREVDKENIKNSLEDKVDTNVDIGMNETKDVKLVKEVPSEPAEMTAVERIVLAVAAKLREDEENERIRLEDIIAANKEKAIKEREESNISVQNEQLKLEENQPKSKENVEKEPTESSEDNKNQNSDSSIENKNQNLDSATENKNQNLDTASENKNQNLDSATENKNQNLDTASENKNQNLDSATENKNQNLDMANENKNQNLDSATENKNQNLDTASENKNQNLDSATENKNQNLDMANENKNQNLDSATENKNQNLDTAIENKNQNLDSATENKNQNLDTAIENKNQNLDTAIENKNQNLDTAIENKTSGSDNKIIDLKQTTKLDENVEKNTIDDLVNGEHFVSKSSKEQKAQEEKEIDSKEVKHDEKPKDNQNESETDASLVQKVEDKIKQSTQFDTNIIKTLEVTATENQNTLDTKINSNELGSNDESEKSKSIINEVSFKNVEDNLLNCSTIKADTSASSPENQTSVPTSQGKC